MSYKIVISGYYGFGNVGDEAALDGILTSLRQVGIDAQVTVLSVDPERTCREHPGVDSAHRCRVASLVRAIRGADLVISGGGSLLQDVTSAASPHYYLFVVNLARMLRRRTMVFAQGVGPLIRPITRRAVAWTLNRVDVVTVRDEDSKAFLQEIGLTRPQIYVAADPSFLVEPDLEAADRILAESGLEAGRFIAVALRPWGGSDERLRDAAEGIAEAASEIGVKVALLPMQEPQDIAACELVSGAVMLSGIGDVRAIKGVVARAGLVVGMRLHSLIFAASEGVPFVPVVYDPKVASFAAACGIEARISVESLDPRSVATELRAAWESREAAAAQLAARRGGMRESALVSATLAKELLAGM